MSYRVTVHDPCDDSIDEVVERGEFANRQAARIWPTDPPTPIARYVANHRAAPEQLRRVSVRARAADGTLVGLAGSVFDETANDHPQLGWIGIDVDPDHRRRGVGAALVVAMLAPLERWGREVVVAETVDADPDGAAFATAIGATSQGGDGETTIWAVPLQVLKEHLARSTLPGPAHG